MIPAMRRGRLAEAGDYLLLWRFCLANLGVLRLAPYQRRCLQLFLDGAEKTAAGSGLRAAAVGALAVAVALDALSAHADLAVRMVLLGVVRELAPLLAALIVLIRVGSPVTGDIALMPARGEERALRLLGLSSRAYIAVPPLVAVTSLALVFTFYFELLVLGGGIGLGALLFGLPLSGMLNQVALLVTPGDLLYTVAKSLGFGLVIGSVSVHQGLRPGLDAARLPDALAASVMQCLSLLLALNAVLAWFAYGLAA